MEDKTAEREDWWRFISICQKLDGEHQLSEFLDLFLTLEEKEDLKLRFLIVEALLKEKNSQREISSHLGVSISKITRGSNALKIISSKLKEFLETHLN